MYTVQVVSTTPYSLKTMSLKRAPTTGTVGRAYIPRTGEAEEPGIAGVQLTNQPAVTSLDDLLQVMDFSTFP